MGKALPKMSGTDGKADTENVPRRTRYYSDNKKEMNTRTSKYRNDNRRGKKDSPVKDEKPAFVPRHVALKFMALDGVQDVKPSMNTPEWLKIVVIPKDKSGYNHELHYDILRVEYEIAAALKSRNQKFEASISW